MNPNMHGRQAREPQNSDSGIRVYFGLVTTNKRALRCGNTKPKIEPN